ncbi:unnamed protein product [Ixodes hexagonus]
MFCSIAVTLLSIVSTGIASTQTPNVTSCSGKNVCIDGYVQRSYVAATHIVIIDDVTITNAKVGGTMVLRYSGQLTQDIDGSPSLKLTMRKKKGGIKLPCISNIGSW